MIRGMRLLVVVLAFGCKREPDRSVPTNPGSGSAPRAAPRVILDEVCTPRAVTPDPGPTKRDPYAPPSTVVDQCVRHADCTIAAHGRCVPMPWREAYTFGERREVPAHNECVYDECTSDDECRRTTTHEPRAEKICICAEERNTCTFANCRKDSDCAAPYTCGTWRYCHAAADACSPTKPCKAAGEECRYSWDLAHYVCEVPVNIAPD